MTEKDAGSRIKSGMTRSAKAHLKKPFTPDDIELKKLIL